MNMLDYLLLIVLGFIFITFTFNLLITMKYVIGHQRRAKITFKNFESKIKYFNTEIPNNYYLITTGFLVVSIITALSIIFSGYIEYYGYLWSIGLLLILTIALYTIFKFLEHHNIDITVLKRNHTQVKENIKVTNQATNNLLEIKTYRTDTFKVIQAFEKQISTVDNYKIYNLRDALQVVDEFIIKQEEKIALYKQELLLSFSETLTLFQQDNTQVALKLPGINLEFQNEYKAIKQNIYDKYNNVFNETLYTLINTSKYQTKEQIELGLVTLRENNYKPTEKLIGLILSKIDVIKGSNLDIINYLLTNEIITLDELTEYAIKENQSWVFKLDLYKTIEELVTITKILIQKDAYHLSIQFISKYYLSLFNVLSFLDKLEEINKTTLLFFNYRKLQNFDSTYFSEHKVLENKVITLKNFYKDKKPSQKLKNDLYAVNNISIADKNKEIIDRLYSYTIDKYETLHTQSIKSILLYITEFKDGGLLNIQKLTHSLNDYYNRFMFKELSILVIVLYSLFLHKNENEELYHDVIKELQSKELSTFIPSNKIKSDFIKRKIIAKELIRHLEHNYIHSLSNIILKIEKERCTLDILNRGE